MKTARITSIQPTVCHTYNEVSSVPTFCKSSARIALTVMVIGFHSAKCCNHSGMVCTGTKTELAKTSGKIQMKPATCAVSMLRTHIPMVAETHENANPKRSRSANALTASDSEPCKRKPSK